MSLLLVCDTAWTALNEMKLIILPTLKWMAKALTISNQMTSLAQNVHKIYQL